MEGTRPELNRLNRFPRLPCGKRWDESLPFAMPHPCAEIIRGSTGDLRTAQCLRIRPQESTPPPEAA
jgi:hypothetical protein